MKKIFTDWGTVETNLDMPNKSFMAFSPEEIKVAMAALMIRQSKLYDMRNDIDKALAFNAELHQRFADVWQVEAAGIETHLDAMKHEEEQKRLAAQSPQETSNSVSNGTGNATNS